MENNEIKGKSIFNPCIARWLVRRGHHIMDIKPSKENRDKTIFIFSVTDEFIQDLSTCNEQRAATRDELEAHGIELGV